MKIANIKPIKIAVKGLIELDESEFSAESYQPFYSKVKTEIAKLDIAEGYYAVQVSYTTPTNRAKTRFAKKRI